MNAIILGTAGKGRVIHPWDNLPKCKKCGNKNLYMVGKDGKDFYSGAPYQIKCSCGNSSISSDDISLVRKNWENQEGDL